MIIRPTGSLQLKRKLVLATIASLVGALLLPVGSANATASRLLFHVAENLKPPSINAAQRLILQSVRRRSTTQAVLITRLLVVPAKGSSVDLQLPRMPKVTLRVHPTGVRGLFKMTGSVPGGGGITLIAQGDRVSGAIASPSIVYEIQPLGGGIHAIVTVDQAQFEDDEPELNEPEHLAAQPEARDETARGSISQANPEIVALVAFTPNAKAWAIANGTSIEALATMAVEQVNTAFAPEGNREVNASARAATDAPILFNYVEGHHPRVENP